MCALISSYFLDGDHYYCILYSNYYTLKNTWQILNEYKKYQLKLTSDIVSIIEDITFLRN